MSHFSRSFSPHKRAIMQGMMESLNNIGGAVGGGLGGLGNLGGTVGGIFNPTGTTPRQEMSVDGEAGDAIAQLQRQKKLVTESLALNEKVIQIADKDIFNLPMPLSPGFRTKSTVGIMLNDCTVENLVVGGPAFISRKISNGDTIRCIDSVAVNADNILQHLVGSDVPGTDVLLDVEKKGGGRKEVKLKRMAVALIAPKLQMFQKFTDCKEKAMELKDQGMLKLVEECISTWTEMTIADGEREEKIKASAACMREETVSEARDLDKTIRDIQVLTADLSASFDVLRENESKLKAELEEVRRKLLVLQDVEGKLHDANSRIKELELALQKAESLNVSLSKEIEASQAREVKIKSDYTKATSELQDARSTILELERKLEQANKMNAKLQADVVRKDTELDEELSRSRKLDADLKTTQARVNDLDYQKSNLERGLQDAKAALLSSQQKYTQAESELEEALKRLKQKEKECRGVCDERDELLVKVQQAEQREKETREKMQKDIDDKSATISSLEVEKDVMRKEERLLQQKLSDSKEANTVLEMEKKKILGQKCTLETELEGNVIRIRSLEQQLKEALAGKVHYQSETDVLMPAKDDLQRRLISAEIDLKARVEEVERLSREGVQTRTALESEKTAHLMAVKNLEKASEEHKNALQEVRILTSDLHQCNTELSTSRELAKTFENKLAEVNVELDKSKTELRQALLKVDALELSTRDLEDRLASALQTVTKQKDELGNMADKMEAHEKASRKVSLEKESVELRLHEVRERERLLQRETDDLRASINSEIKKTAETHSHLVQEQTSNRLLVRELGDTRQESHKTQRALRTVEEADKQHQIVIADMTGELNRMRSTLESESASMMQMITVARVAVEQMHHELLPQTPSSYPNEDSKELIPRLHQEACVAAREIHNKIARLQKENETLTTKLSEIESLRQQNQTVTHAKTGIEMQLKEANDRITKLDGELGAKKGELARLDESLSAARDLHAAAEKKVRGLQGDLDATIETNRVEVKRLLGEIEQLKKVLGDKEHLADDLRHQTEENDTFKRLLKASLEAQEQTYEALCGKRTGNAGLGMVVQVVNGITRVKSVIPGGAASDSETPLRSGDIIEEVDDASLAGATLSAVQNMFMGPIGSAVNLTFRRNVLPSPRSSTASVTAESPRLSVKLNRNDTVSNVEGIAQRARDMCQVANSLRTSAADLEQRVKELSGTVEVRDKDLASVRSAREEAVKLVNALEQRVRSRDAEIEAIRAEALQAKNRLHTANLENENLIMQKRKAEDSLSFSQRRIKELEQALDRMEIRDKQISAKVVKLEGELERLREALRQAEEAGRDAADLRRQLVVLERRALASEDRLRALQEETALLKQQLDDALARNKQVEGELVEMISLNRQLLDAMQGHRQEWQGVGMTVRVAKTVTIKEISSDGAAAHSGLLHQGDTLLECEGRSLAGLSSEQVQNLILGRAGSQVHFKVRTSRGKVLTVALVRGDQGTKSFSDELRQAVDCAEAMHVETAKLRDLLQAVLAQVHVRENDVERTLSTVERGFADARVSWLDVSSSVHAFSVPNPGKPTSPPGDQSGLSNGCAEGNFASKSPDAETASTVETGTQQSRIALARMADLTLEALRQITDLVKTRAHLKESIAHESKLRHEHESTIGHLKEDMAVMSKRIEKVTHEYTDLLTEQSEAANFEAKIHAILRGKEVELIGVGMVVKLEGRSSYPVIKSLVPGGAAESCGQFSVGDAILIVDGKDVEGLDAQHLTPLFRGPLGSTLTIIAAKYPGAEDSFFSGTFGSLTQRSSIGGSAGEWLTDFGGMLTQRTTKSTASTARQLLGKSYTVTLVRNSTSATGQSSKFNVLALKKDRPESIELARKYAQRMIVILKELEEANKKLGERDLEIVRLNGETADLRAELLRAKEDLKVATTELRECKLALESEKEHSANLSRDLKEAQETVLLLKTQVLDLTKDMENLRKQLATMTQRAQAAEDESHALRRKLKLAREELDIANSTIQGLQAHVDELKHKLSVCEQQLVQAEAVKQNLTRELEEAHAEMQRLLANIQALEMQTKELEAQLVIKDDEVRELKYKLDLCPYKCKKVEAPAPAPPPPELEPEDDPTKYVGVGMVVRVETGKSHIEYCNGTYMLCHTQSIVHDDLLQLDG